MSPSDRTGICILCDTHHRTRSQRGFAPSESVYQRPNIVLGPLLHRRISALPTMCNSSLEVDCPDLTTGRGAEEGEGISCHDCCAKYKYNSTNRARRSGFPTSYLHGSSFFSVFFNGDCHICSYLRASPFVSVFFNGDCHISHIYDVGHLLLQRWRRNSNLKLTPGRCLSVCGTA
jgi:hypothetical protein